MGRMGEDPGPALRSAASDDKRFRIYGEPTQQQVTQPEPGRHATRRRTRTQVAPAHSPAEAAPPYTPQPYAAQQYTAPPHQARTYRAPASRTGPSQARKYQPPTYQAPEPEPDEIVRYGPGVPTGSRASLTAETLRRGGHPSPSRRRVRLHRLLGSALTVILLAASGVILYLRFHHAPFEVANVEIAQEAPSGCGVDVTGLITTNGAAGTISYQWLSRPPRGTPRPLSQTVSAGQDDVYVTVAVQGVGRGTGSEVLTLQVLGPDTRSASTGVVISC
jgi:hypothetical protein